MKQGGNRKGWDPLREEFGSPRHPGAWKKHTTILSSWGLHLSHRAPVASWNWMSSLENWKKSQHCSFFTSFVLDIYISWYGKLTLKTAGVCAHWIGSVVKGEQVQRRGWVVLPVSVMKLVPKAECESSPLTLKKGRGEVQIKLGVSEG